LVIKKHQAKPKLCHFPADINTPAMHPLWYLSITGQHVKTPCTDTLKQLRPKGEEDQELEKRLV
jgi:hypothetical protein